MGIKLQWWVLGFPTKCYTLGRHITFNRNRTSLVASEVSASFLSVCLLPSVCCCVSQNQLLEISHYAARWETMCHCLLEPSQSHRNIPNCSSAQMAVWVCLTPRRGSHCLRAHTVKTSLQHSKTGQILLNGVKINLATSGRSPVISSM